MTTAVAAWAVWISDRPSRSINLRFGASRRIKGYPAAEAFHGLQRTGWRFKAQEKPGAAGLFCGRMLRSFRYESVRVLLVLMRGKRPDKSGPTRARAVFGSRTVRSLLALMREQRQGKSEPAKDAEPLLATELSCCLHAH
jgi:hypothetical protein